MAQELADVSLYDPDAAFRSARSLAFNGNRISARDTLKQILRDYPDYIDVQAFLANTYRWDGDHDSARRHFNRIISRERGREDVWVNAIQNELKDGNTSIALGLANKALHFLGSSAPVEDIRREILAESDNGFTGKVGLASKDRAEVKEFRNVVSVSNTVEVFDQFYDPMYYGTVEYQGKTRSGKVVPRINYSNRFGINGLQYELDLYPKISETFYAYINYGYSDAEIFSRHRAGLEVFVNLPKALEASLGARYLDFRDVQATLLTGSLGMYRGNYYLSLRPFITMLNGRRPAVSGSFTARKYLSDNYNYLGIKLSYGFSPELRQLGNGNTLIAESLLFIESRQLWMEYQLSDSKGQHLYKARLGLVRQEYILQPGAFFWVFSGGLTYSLRI